MQHDGEHRGQEGRLEEMCIRDRFGRFHTAQDVAEADIEEIESYIRSVGLYKNKARNMKKCCEQIWKEYGGKVPDTLDEVLKLAGVGRKTGTLFLAVSYTHLSQYMYFCIGR